MATFIRPKGGYTGFQVATISPIFLILSKKQLRCFHTFCRVLMFELYLKQDYKSA